MKQQSTATCCLVVLALLVAVSHAQFNDAPLRLLTDYVDSDKAVCLDGTPGGYYHFPGHGDGVDKWILFFEGGGWCYNAEQCLARAKGGLGSSNSWARLQNSSTLYTGIISTDCNVNPTFCNWNHVYIMYCDGTSFLSNYTRVLKETNQTLHFRGRPILNAVLKDLAKLPYGTRWKAAKQVALSGCSAGGLSTLNAADYVASQLPSSVTKFGAIPVSGYFLHQTNVRGEEVYPEQMYNLYTLANLWTQVNPKCRATKSVYEGYQCMFAEYIYNYIDAPVFVINSEFDSWSLGCIYTAAPDDNFTPKCSQVPGWMSCTQKHVCTPAQWRVLNQWGAAFQATLGKSKNYMKSVNGGFINSCMTHCEGNNNNVYTRVNIRGINMSKAVDVWWNTFTESQLPQWNWDCSQYNVSSPHYCNPTCGSIGSQCTSVWN